MPESPRWVLQKRSEDEARHILLLTRDPKTIDAEIRSMKEIKTEERVSISTLLSPAIRPILFIGIGIAIFQQVIGTNTIIYYTPTILENAGFGAPVPLQEP